MREHEMQIQLDIVSSMHAARSDTCCGFSTVPEVAALELIVQQHTAKSQQFWSDHSLQLVASI